MCICKTQYELVLPVDPFINKPFIKHATTHCVLVYWKIFEDQSNNNHVMPMVLVKPMHCHNGFEEKKI